MINDYAVFVGDVALDEYYQAERHPALREKIGVDMLPAQMGGMIANAACVYASYGNETRFLSILNHADRKLCDDLNKNHINTDMVQYDDSLPDSKCIILLAEGEHTVLIINRKVTKLELPHEVQQQLCGARIIYSDCGQLAPLSCGELDARGVLKQWRDAGVRLVCDIDVGELSDTAQQLFPYIHTLFMNEIGFAWLSKGRTADETVRAMGAQGVEIMIVTLAEQGCTIFDTKSGNLTHIPGVPSKVVDVTGAGDTFCSSFTNFYNLSGDIQLSGTFANYAAALSVQKLGARGGAVGYVAVLEFMQSHGIDTVPYDVFIANNNMTKN